MLPAHLLDLLFEILKMTFVTVELPLLFQKFFRERREMP